MRERKRRGELLGGTEKEQKKTVGKENDGWNPLGGTEEEDYSSSSASHQARISMCKNICIYINSCSKCIQLV